MYYILDCRYHTTWQSEPSMSWLLRDIKGKRALLEADRKRKQTQHDKSVFGQMLKV